MRSRHNVTILTLLYVLLTFCAASVIMCLITKMRDRILPAAFFGLLKSIATVYATPVSVAVAGSFQRSRRRTPVDYPVAAAILVLLWGFIVLIPFVMLVITNDMQADDVSQFCDIAAKNWAFLISAVLAFNVGTAKENGP
jgi:hypothetical protein